MTRGIVSPSRGEETLTQIPEATLEQIEKQHARGIASVEILKLFDDHGIKFSEATLRKYVQLGLLPRSVRVGRKGKHTGSSGLYPVTIVRQIGVIKTMMADSLTIEEIQREFLFVRGDIEELERKLGTIFKTLRDSTKQQRSEPAARSITADIGAAEAMAKDLVGKLSQLEDRLTLQARTARRAAG